MTDRPILAPVDQRILGSLLEKQRTVPASYPLTLNALRLACNQTTSREPVTDIDEATLEDALTDLRHRELVRVVWADTGRRTLKYHQTLDERLSLQPDERALVTVLLLRGAQSAGELKTRTERLHPFADRGEVEQCLRRLASLPTPLVQELERRPGQHDTRWVHLLGPVETGAPMAAATHGDDLESVLRDGPEARDARVRASYEALAAAYGDRYEGVLADQPFEQWLLDRVAADAGSHPVADVGCGTGQLTAFLAGRGTRAFGFDVVPAMVAEARRRHPELPFEVADLHRMLKPRDDDGWGAVLAFYSLSHLAPSELGTAVASLARILRPGGRLLLALGAGPALRHRDEWLGVDVDLDLVEHDPAHVRSVVADAGLRDVEWYLRGPRTAAGETTGRLFVLATR